MRFMLLGIAIIIFGIAFSMESSGTTSGFGLMISFVGLLVSIVSCFVVGKSK
jgi:hypothetical protein